jgi:hypothetical protein
VPLAKPIMFSIESKKIMWNIQKIIILSHQGISIQDQIDDSMAIQNRQLRFAQMNIFGLCL